MSTSGVNNSSSSSTASGVSAAAASAFTSMTPEDFIKMLVAQLQNQDPTQPVDNSEILQQVSQIEAITTDQQLNTTLTSVLLGQNVATASALLSKTVTGADASGNAVSGTVSSVSFSGGAATLTVNGQTIALSSVTGVQP